MDIATGARAPVESVTTLAQLTLIHWRANKKPIPDNLTIITNYAGSISRPADFGPHPMQLVSIPIPNELRTSPRLKITIRWALVSQDLPAFERGCSLAKYLYLVANPPSTSFTDTASTDAVHTMSSARGAYQAERSPRRMVCEKADRCSYSAKLVSLYDFISWLCVVSNDRYMEHGDERSDHKLETERSLREVRGSDAQGTDSRITVGGCQSGRHHFPRAKLRSCYIPDICHLDAASR